MSTEIERKYLVQGEAWKKDVSQSTPIEQGYFPTQKGVTVRVRRRGGQGYLTVKGPSFGISRAEFEYEIPLSDAIEMLETLCQKGRIQKVRHVIPWGNHLWELDVFEGENQGLVTAEIELRSEQEAFEKPAWLGKEVSEDPRYRNAALVKMPFSQWEAD